MAENEERYPTYMLGVSLHFRQKGLLFCRVSLFIFGRSLYVTALRKFWSHCDSHYRIIWYQSHYSCTGNHFYGTEYEIWTDCGPVGNTEKSLGPIMSNF